jgi:hypothetical protein
MNSGLKKLTAKIAALKSATRNLFDVFLGDKKGREKKMAAGIVAFRSGIWLIVFATISLVTLLRKLGLSYISIFMIFWIGNMILTVCVIKANKTTKIDFTSMEGSRNLLRKAQEKSKLLGYLAEAWLFFWLLIYSGPEQFFIFFEERFSSKTMKVLVFILITLCYSSIWSLVFVKGADGFWDLMSRLY